MEIVLRTNEKKLIFSIHATGPADVFRTLELKDKDRLKWILLKDGTVIVEKVRR